VSTEPGFPVEPGGVTELHAAFREESRTLLLSASAALQEIRGAADLFVVFSKENHTSRSLWGSATVKPL
jgi:hypothetical protein